MMYLGDPPKLYEHLLTKNKSRCLEMKQTAEESSSAYYECVRVNAVLKGRKIVSIINKHLFVRIILRYYTLVIFGNNVTLLL